MESMWAKISINETGSEVAEKLKAYIDAKNDLISALGRECLEVSLDEARGGEKDGRQG